MTHYSASLLPFMFLAGAAQAQPAWEQAPRWLCKTEHEIACNDADECSIEQFSTLREIDFPENTIWTLALEDPNKKLFSIPITHRAYREGLQATFILGAEFQLFRISGQIDRTSIIWDSYPLSIASLGGIGPGNVLVGECQPHE